MRIVPPYRGINTPLPRRLRWRRARTPTRRRIPKLYRPEGRTITRPSARNSLAQLLATLAVVGAIWVLGALFQTAFAARIYPHVTIDSVPVGGMTRDEALAALQRTENARVHSPIFVQAAGKAWTVTPAQFGARYNIAAAVDRALALNHRGPPVLGGWEEFKAIVQGANVPLSGTHDPPAVRRFLAQVAVDVHISPRGTVVGVRGDDAVILHEAVPGRRLNMDGAVAALSTAVNTHDAAAVTLPVQPVYSALGHAQAEEVLARAHALLAAPIRFEWTNGQSWVLDRRGMARLLTFTPRCRGDACHFDMGIDAGRLGDAFNRGGVADSVDRAPTPARYQLNLDIPSQPGVIILPDTPGQTIDVAAAAQEVLQQANVPAGDPRTILLPTLPLTATFNTQVAESLHFDQSVGTSSFRFRGLDNAQMSNLGTATNAISNTIVAPGKTFDLAEVVGPLSATNGYTVGVNVIGPNDITGANGGVTMAAASVLAAAYDAGYSIVQRAHYPYVSGFLPLGWDAIITCRAPHNRRAFQKACDNGKHDLDLVFRNTTDHPMLVMTSNDGAGQVGIYIFNNSDYAPDHRRGAYSSQTAAPQITLNPDGSVDTIIRRTVAVGNHVSQDSISSHNEPIDP